MRPGIAWTRDPAGMTRDERMAELGLLFALGLGRLSESGQILQFAVDDRSPVEPSCANSPVNSRAMGGMR